MFVQKYTLLTFWLIFLALCNSSGGDFLHISKFTEELSIFQPPIGQLLYQFRVAAMELFDHSRLCYRSHVPSVSAKHFLNVLSQYLSKGKFELFNDTLNG